MPLAPASPRRVTGAGREPVQLAPRSQVTGGPLRTFCTHISSDTRASPRPPENAPLKIAVVGTGIAGLSAAAALHPDHELTLYEAEAQPGGHALTVDVPEADIEATLGHPTGRELAERTRRPLAVPPSTTSPAGTRTHAADLGFMVWNHHTYPGLKAMFEALGVETAPTSMGFSLSDVRTGLEYAGESLDGVFAQRRNLVRPSFLRMLLQIQRFNRLAPGWTRGAHAGASLGELLERERFSREFRDHYLVPMGAAIWSASEHDMLAFPAAFFVRFLQNHGMLEPPSRQFQWRVVTGGSRRYVQALTRPFADRIRLSTPVRRVTRTATGVNVATDHGTEHFDEAVLALHADQALAILADASPRERETLAAFPYRTNTAVLHTDTSLLPRSRRAWASWNYHVPADHGAPVGVTYDLSRLQHLATPAPLLLTLNDRGMAAPGRVLQRRSFAHPVFTRDSVAMQAQHAQRSGQDRVHFCGAYWRNGFHEDGLVSGRAVAGHILSRHALAAR